MKTFSRYFFLFIFLLLGTPVFAQDDYDEEEQEDDVTVNAGSQNQNSGYVPSVFEAVDYETGYVDSNLPTSGPKEDLAPIEFLNPRADDIFWQKVVYRMIDLREKINYPLYYPEDASDGRQSLFAFIFTLLQDGTS